MSMLLRHQPPLAIFFWCFMPMVLSFLAANQGQSMMSNYRIAPQTGMIMLWSGNALLGAMVLGVYAKLRRN